MQYESIYIMFRDVYTDCKTTEITITNCLGVGWKGCELEGPYWADSGDLAMLCFGT